MERESLENAVERGLSTYKIATEFNTSQTNVRHWLNKYTLKTDISKQRNGGSCIVCAKTLIGNQSKFCSKSCKMKEHYASSDEYSSRIYAAQKKRKKEKKTNLVEQLGGKCSICGYGKNSSSLVFHHLSDKHFILSSADKPLSVMKKEADKCILVCHNCHESIHHPEFNNWQTKVFLNEILINNGNKPNQKYRGLKKKTEFVSSLGGKCSKCGYSDNLCALHFHHERDKKFKLNIRMMNGRSLEALTEEVAKCILLCGNCHSEHHNPQCKLD